MKRDPHFATPQEAESAFYDAFERGDIDSMMSVWTNDEHAVCIHPGSARLQGHAEIREGWTQIFANESALRFSLTDNYCTQGALLSIHLVRENIEVDGVLRGVVLATNVYQLIDGSWRMLLHHASPDPEAVAETPSTETLH